MGTNLHLSFLFDTVVLHVPGHTLHHNVEVTPNFAVKDLAEFLRQTNAVVQQVLQVIVGRICLWNSKNEEKK